MERDTFLHLPVEEVAALVRATGPKVCVLPVNGTRRWFMLEHESNANSAEHYLSVVYHRQIEICRLFFEHGINTLLAPMFGTELLQRGPEYLQMVAEGLAQLTQNPLFVDFYRECGVRVRFYGDYRKMLKATPYAYLTDMFDQTAADTRNHSPHRLFFGVFANDATETIAELGVTYFQQHGQIPDRHALVEMYYGEYVEPVSLFIGFDKFSAFDMPLLALGEEDLYFTVSPTFYITEHVLRLILYDHLYARRTPEPDYHTMPTEAHERMRAFYHSHTESVLGLGTSQDGIWYPYLLSATGTGS